MSSPESNGALQEPDVLSGSTEAREPMLESDSPKLSISPLHDVHSPVNTTDAPRRPRRKVKKTASPAKRSTQGPERRIKLKNQTSPPTASSSDSTTEQQLQKGANRSAASIASANEATSLDRSHGSGSDENSPFLGVSGEQTRHTELQPDDHDVEAGYESHHRSRGPCSCRKILTDLLKISSYSYLNFGLVLAPFPFLVYFADWNRGLLFILSYLTLFPLSTFLHSTVAAVKTTFPTWFSSLFSLVMRNALALLVGIFAVHYSMERMMQGLVIGLLIHRLFLMLGLTLTVAASRSTSIRVEEKSVRIAASILFLAVIMLTLPSFFRLSSPDAGVLGLLKISRWCAVFLLFLQMFLLFYSMKSEKKMWEATNLLNQTLRVHPFTTLVVVLIGLGLGGFTSWFLVVSTTFVYTNWGISYTFIAGILLPIALNAPDFVSYAKLAFLGNVKPSMLDAIKASLEVCLFIAPLLIIGAWIAAKSVGLALLGLVSMSCVLATINLSLLLSALRATWIQGVMMTIAYLLFTVGYFLQNE